jgi:hypothetical protein
MRATGLLCAKLENVVMVITFHFSLITGFDVAPWMGWRPGSHDVDWA